MESRINKVITYIVQMAIMLFASYMLYLGLVQAYVNPQAASDFAIALFLTFCILDMLLSDKSELHQSHED